MALAVGKIDQRLNAAIDDTLRSRMRQLRRSPTGVFRGRLRAAPIRDGNLEVHWPEGNVLLAGAAHDPESLEPDYNAVVTIETTGG